jgi:mono/diheme cytochrome c family protein
MHGMKLRIAICAALASMITTAFPLFAQGLPGNSSEGLMLASRLCANCHATDPKGANITRTEVPSFRIIADSPITTPERLAGAIILPHPEMPGVPLTRAEIRHIIAYIMSLKQQP